ncbi:hypothetical protein B9G98_04349 [Wickerhamiella sorbophila]|uniref:Uncharacterized protein n=1 Tax=Wickerhamiella sorbophila TaxID=45607 RepID=A0A2T0FP44_9ASCO|nr:hypothetical protein B9G98_04349 [Wickerhamiella sorbophila]PRT56729.1 hypothetical protein B9G98_04349 [Wickerhamiella sorbophila]
MARRPSVLVTITRVVSNWCLTKSMKLWFTFAFATSVCYAAVVDDLLTSAAEGFSLWASSLEGWNSGVGYDSAMIMQLSDYDPLSMQLSQLNDSVANMPVPHEEDYKLLYTSLNNLTGAVTEALSTLNQKAADFYSVGANQVIGADISQFSSAIEAIFNHVVGFLPENVDCQIKLPLSRTYDNLTSAFNSAATTFSTQVKNFTSLLDNSCISVGTTSGSKHAHSNGSFYQVAPVGLAFFFSALIALF